MRQCLGRRLGVAFALAAVVMLSACVSRETPVSEAVVFESEACARAYREFYQNRSIDIRVVFGYKDARPARFVADAYERLIFIRHLVSPCASSGDHACGFRRSEKDADLFVKRILGPDARPREVFLRVVHASVGADDEQNRKNPAQRWRSEYAEATFLSGLKNADAVFYNGHSRAGGGPDFFPPKINSKGEILFAWYKKQEPGFRKTLDALASKGRPTGEKGNGAASRVGNLRLLGLFSCASSKLFMDRVRFVRPEIGLITSSKLIYFSDAMESSLETLSGLLGMGCEKRFEEFMGKPSNQAAGAQIIGFF